MTKPSKAEALTYVANIKDWVSDIRKSDREDFRIHCDAVAEFITALPDEPAPSPTDECDHDFVLQHSSSINICRNCGIMETPSIAGRMAAKRALKEAFKHFDTPSPTNPEGLEWGKGDRLLYNKRGIGSAYHYPNKGGDYTWDFLDNDGGREKSLEAAKIALESAARSWLSPVSEASGERLPKRFNPNHGWAHTFDQDLPAFILRFCDQDVEDIAFSGHGAEEAALKTWEVKNAAWNCALYKSMRTVPVSEATDTVRVKREDAEYWLCVRTSFDNGPDLDKYYEVKNRLRASLNGGADV